MYWDLLGTIRTPWLLGVVTLALYGAAAWFVCEALGITSRAGVVLVSGLMVTCPTMISSNFYLTSAHIYAGALLFAAWLPMPTKMAAQLDRRVCVYAAV